MWHCTQDRGPGKQARSGTVHRTVGQVNRLGVALRRTEGQADRLGVALYTGQRAR